LPVSSTIEGEDIAEVMAPMLQIMPELRELGTVTDLPPAMAHVKVDIPATMSLSEQSDVAHTPIPSLPPHGSDALFAEEVCDLLIKLDVAIPGLGRSIACLLTGTAIRGKIRRWVMALEPASGRRSHLGAKAIRMLSQKRRRRQLD
jgi:hypothetical protein